MFDTVPLFFQRFTEIKNFWETNICRDMYSISVFFFFLEIISSYHEINKLQAEIW